ncbi:hypothetical protein MHYP_G00252480 [Metynnis hypsauchen]
MKTSLKTRSHASASTSSRTSSTSVAAAAARAKAEAAKTRLKYTEKEIRMRMEKVQLEATMEMLAIEKEIAVATAKAEALEAAATMSEGRLSCKLPVASSILSIQRTQDYVQEQAKRCEERSLAPEEDPPFQDEAKWSHTQPSIVKSECNPESVVLPAANTHDFSHTPIKYESQNPFLISNVDCTPTQFSQPLHSVTFKKEDEECLPSCPQSQPILQSPHSNTSASAQHGGLSLNDVLLKGPDLNNTLLGVLIRFRKEAVAATADIKQMFYCFRKEKSIRAETSKREDELLYHSSATGTQSEV